MLAIAIRVINSHSPPPPYIHHSLLKLFFLMYGHLLFSHMMGLNITLSLSIILQNTYGFFWCWLDHCPPTIPSNISGDRYPPSYNMFLGRPWILADRAVISSLYQWVKFIINENWVTIKVEKTLFMIRIKANNGHRFILITIDCFTK